MDCTPRSSTLADFPRKAARSICRRRTGGRARRVTCPRVASKVKADLRRRRGRCENLSLTNLAQWYLDIRYPSEGQKGLLYSVPKLPGTHSPESVAQALDATIQALRPEVASTVGWDSGVVPPALNGLSLNPPSPLSTKHTTSAGPLIDHPELPGSTQDHRSEAVSVSGGSLIDVPDFEDVLVVNPESASIDELLFAPLVRPATLCAPLLPSRAEKQSASGSEQHRNFVQESKYRPFRKEHLHETAPQIRRKPAARDLKVRAVTLPALVPRHDPGCLQVGRPLSDGKVMPRKAFAHTESLKVRVPSGVNKWDLPEALKSAGNDTGRSPGPYGEIDCLISAVDVVKDDFQPRLDPLEPNLGRFSCGFHTPASRQYSDNRRSKSEEVRSMSSRSSDSASAARKSTAQRTSSSSILFSNDESLHALEGRAKPQTAGDRPLPPLPLVPDPNNSKLLTPAASLAMSNATLKALLAAEDASNHTYDSSTYDLESRLAKSRLSQHSAGLVRDFSDFTHRRFFPQADAMRSKSEGTTSPQDVARVGKAPAADQQARSWSVGSLAVRKAKGKGIVFDIGNTEIETAFESEKL